MKLDLGTQSFMQNTFSIFGLTIFNVLTLKITVQRYLYFYVTSGFWIFDPRVCHIYLFWWRHFDITSDFLFNKLFSLSSNISSFSFKQREHLFDWGLYALNWFFTTHVTFGLELPAFKFHYSTDSFISFLYLLILNNLLWFAYRFLNVFLLIPL